MRYHCPIYCYISFIKQKAGPYKRLIWQYDRADFEALRLDASRCDWDSFYNLEIDAYARNITDCILNLAKKHIPSKNVTVRPSDPSWLHNDIHRLMRKRKRLYDKAKQTNTDNAWTDYRRIRGVFKM